MTFPGEKLVLKLWETLVEKGIGLALQPWHEKRIGIARNEIRRDEILMLAEASKAVEDIKSGKADYVKGEIIRLSTQEEDIDSRGRVEPKLNLISLSKLAINANESELMRKEINVSKAIIIAEGILENNTQEVPVNKIEDDWLFTWREHAGKVSSSELQDLWGRILAGEFKNPGSYSLRTMDFLKGLSKSEAERISKVAQFIVNNSILRGREDFLKKEGVEFKDLLSLQEIGIIIGVESTGLTSTYGSNKKESFGQILVSHNKAIIIHHDDNSKKLVQSAYFITTIGQQVFALTSPVANMEYITSIAQDCARQGYTVTLADWKYINETSGQYTNAVSIEA